MNPLLILLLAGGGAAALLAASSSSASSPTAGSSGGSKDEGLPVPADGVPKLESLSLSLWSQAPAGTPQAALNTRGEKFTDPWQLSGCWSGTSTSDIDYLLKTPKNGAARISRMMQKAQATVIKQSTALDMLASAAGPDTGAVTSNLAAELKKRQKYWGDKIKQYAKYTDNGWVMAFAEAYAWLLKVMPASWAPEYKRAVAIVDSESDRLQAAVVNHFAMGMPFPLHILDNVSKWTMNDLKWTNERMVANINKMLSLPDDGKRLISAWFSMMTSLMHDPDVQLALNVVDNHGWGSHNLASDEQVYLVGVVFAKAIGADPLKFCSELWEKSRGWSRFPGILSNSNFPWVMTANGKYAAGPSGSNGGVAWNAKGGTRGWSAADGSQCGFTNARQVQMLEIVVTGWEMVAKAKGVPFVVASKMLSIPVLPR